MKAKDYESSAFGSGGASPDARSFKTPSILLERVISSKQNCKKKSAPPGSYKQKELENG